MYRHDLIRSAIVNKDLNKSTFAKESGLALNTVLKLWDGGTNIELESLAKAADFLDISLPELFTPKQEAAAPEVAGN